MAQRSHAAAGVLVASFVLASCGATRASDERETPEPTESVAGGGPVGSSASAGAPGASARTIVCPASYAEARGLVVDCNRDAVPGCSFPEGSCGCEIHYRCSGMPPREGESNAWRVWTCREPPPAFRPDGCPGREPSDGDACDGRAAHCEYGECDFTPYDCVRGQWHRGMASAPPTAAP